VTRRRLIWVAVLAVGSLAAVRPAQWAWEKYGPAPELAAPRLGLPVSGVEDGRVTVRAPGQRLTAELARFDDELTAFLVFDYLRTRRGIAEQELLLTHAEQRGGIVYSLVVAPEGDLLSGWARVYGVAAGLPFLRPAGVVVDGRVVREWRDQTARIVEAYHYPAYRPLEQLTDRELVSLTRRFIQFKSLTDPRIVGSLDPAPQHLDRVESRALAEDIVRVTKFYGLPLDFFLGIGAMENNYMNVKGDLGNTIWKRRAGKGDVVVERRRGRVLVLNESAGVWQITRETLRYAHRVYLKDKRDYGALPEHLRPPRDLDHESLDARTLTTYAGLLFRDLLDRFDGDVGTAVGAYNGGPRNPNPRYEAGVRRVAEYARRMLEQAAEMQVRRAAGQD
jgi:hypothetical protein